MRHHTQTANKFTSVLRRLWTPGRPAGKLCPCPWNWASGGSTVGLTRVSVVPTGFGVPARGHPRPRHRHCESRLDGGRSPGHHTPRRPSGPARYGPGRQSGDRGTEAPPDAARHRDAGAGLMARGSAPSRAEDIAPIFNEYQQEKRFPGEPGLSIDAAFCRQFWAQGYAGGA